MSQGIEEYVTGNWKRSDSYKVPQNLAALYSAGWQAEL